MANTRARTSPREKVKAVGLSWLKPSQGGKLATHAPKPAGDRPSDRPNGGRPGDRGRAKLVSEPSSATASQSGAIASPAAARRESRRANSAALRAEEQGHRAALIAFGMGVALVCIALAREVESVSKAPVAPSGADRQADFQRRMDSHVREVNDQLESQRVAKWRLDIERSRARVSDGVAREPDPVALGVPLKTQPYWMSDNELDQMARRHAYTRDRIESEIRGMVKDEREAIAWEARAQRAFVAEFIRNARNAGWEVDVDQDLNVTYRRAPNSETEEDDGESRAPSLERAPQGLAVPLAREFSVPAFAPLCPWLP